MDPESKNQNKAAYQRKPLSTKSVLFQRRRRWVSYPFFTFSSFEHESTPKNTVLSKTGKQKTITDQGRTRAAPPYLRMRRREGTCRFKALGIKEQSCPGPQRSHNCLWEFFCRLCIQTQTSLRKKIQPPRSKAQRLTICAQKGRVLPLALCIAKMVPHTTEVLELTDGENNLILKPGYTVGEPRPCHEKKRARMHAHTDHNL